MYLTNKIMASDAGVGYLGVEKESFIKSQPYQDESDLKLILMWGKYGNRG